MQWTGFGGCQALVDPQRRVAGSVFGDHRPFRSPKELAVHFFLLFVPPGATQFLCDLEMSNSGSTRKKGSLPATLEVWTEKKLRSKERTTFISLHALCTKCFARFSVSPIFLRANFWWIDPIVWFCSGSHHSRIFNYSCYGYRIIQFALMNEYSFHPCSLGC